MHQTLGHWDSGGYGTGAAVLPRHQAEVVGWCEGTLIAHVDDWVECTDPECEDLQDARHAWAVTCASLWAACPCRPEA